VVSRDGEVLVTVIPDVLLLELIANGTPLADGTVILRSDGRCVRVIRNDPETVPQTGSN
jgi:hypothetical protein